MKVSSKEDSSLKDLLHRFLTLHHLLVHLHVCLIHLQHRFLLLLLLFLCLLLCGRNFLAKWLSEPLARAWW